MRFYPKQHRYYCGVDPHTRTMFLCIVDHTPMAWELAALIGHAVARF